MAILSPKIRLKAPEHSLGIKNRKYPKHLGSLNNVATLADDVRLYAVPKEILRLVDHIWQYGRHQVKQQLFCMF